jgi:hypothetical protein
MATQKSSGRGVRLLTDSERILELPDYRLRRVRRPTAPRLQNIAPNRPKSRPACSAFPQKPPDRIRHVLKTEIEPSTE